MYEPNVTEDLEKTSEPTAPLQQETAPRAGALHDEIRQLRALRDELTLANTELQAQLTHERAKNEDFKRRVDSAEQMQKELAGKVANFESIEAGAALAREWLPDIPLYQEKDSIGRETEVKWGKIIVKEELAEDGTVRTPGIVGFRRQVSFRNDSAYSKDAILGRGKGTLDLMMSHGEFIGPIDNRTMLPQFLNFPPMFRKNPETGKDEQVERVLDVIVLVR